MSKISNDVIRKFIQSNPTSKEIDFLLYIARYQDADGVCRGIYYKEVMEAIDCCKQSFYSIKNSLEEKDIIKIERASKVDYDITIVGNQENWQSGYLNVRKPVLHTQDFKKLPAGAKMIALDLLIIVESNKDAWDIAKDKFLKKYGVEDVCDEEVECVLPFKIKLKTLQEYIRQLKKIFIFKKADNKPKICIVRKHLKNAERPDGRKSDNEVWTEHIIKVLYRRNKIETEFEINNIRDAAHLILQYKDNAREQGKSICKVVISAFDKALEKLQKSIVNPKLIHSYIKNDLFGIPLPF